MIDEYIKSNFNDYIQDECLNLSNMIGLNEVVILYARFMKENDSAEYEFCRSEIDFDDSLDSLVDNDPKFIKIQLNNSKQLIICQFKKDLEHRISMLQCEIEEQEELRESEEQEELHENEDQKELEIFNRTEAVGINDEYQ